MSAARAAPYRRKLLARVAIARKQLALHDDSYRALLARVTGHESAKAASDAQLLAVIAEFERLGLKPYRKASEKPHVRKIFALWASMRGLVQHPSRDALRAFVQRQTGVADPEWLSPDQANKVTEGLKAWRKRVRARQEASDVQ